MSDVPGPADFERRLLNDVLELTAEGVAAEAGVGLREVATFWRALGFADVPGEVAFTRSDVAALRDVLALIDRELITRETAISLVRGLGVAIGRLAEWHAETMSMTVAQAADQVPAGRRQTDAADDGPDTSDAALIAGYHLAGELLPVYERLLIYVWRRKIAAATNRLLSVDDMGEESVLKATMTVGFADLVSFTRLSDVLPGRELAALVEEFEAKASDVIVVQGGRVIKTMGDEVLFAVRTPAAAASIASRLVEDIGLDPEWPEIRVGLATGAVVFRLGDVFGTPTNLAARLTSLAGPNVVLADEQTVKGLVDRPELVAAPLDPVEDAALGQIVPYELVRSRAE